MLQDICEILSCFVSLELCMHVYAKERSCFCQVGWLVWSFAPFHLQHYTTADTCLSAFEGPLDPSTALGGYPGNNYSEVMLYICFFYLSISYSNAFIHCSVPSYFLMLLIFFNFQASAFVITYPVNNAVDGVGDGNGRALAWEKAFVKLAKVWEVLYNCCTAYLCLSNLPLNIICILVFYLFRLLAALNAVSVARFFQFHHQTLVNIYEMKIHVVAI